MNYDIWVCLLRTALKGHGSLICPVGVTGVWTKCRAVIFIYGSFSFSKRGNWPWYDADMKENIMHSCTGLACGRI